MFQTPISTNGRSIWFGSVAPVYLINTSLRLANHISSMIFISLERKSRFKLYLYMRGREKNKEI
jgi:hypothetical protein